MRVLIVGSGAVGGYFGAKLAQSGHEVVFLARGAHAKAIRERGLTVETDEGILSARGRVIEHIDEAQNLDADIALVTVKAQSLGDVAEGTGRALAASGHAIPLLNGLDSEAELANAIGKHRVIGGVAQMAAGQIEPGRTYMRNGGTMVIAPLIAAQKPYVEQLAQEFNKSFTCYAEADVNHVLWQKLLWNAPFNAVCALTRRDAGRALELPELEALVRAAMLELSQVAKAEGVVLDENRIDALVQVTKTMFARTEPSMMQDVVAGRPNERAAIQGAVVARGEKHGIATPIHKTLLALLAGLER